MRLVAVRAKAAVAEMAVISTQGGPRQELVLNGPYNPRVHAKTTAISGPSCILGDIAAIAPVAGPSGDGRPVRVVVGP